jgi:ABC-2 type transport system permease protein
VLGIGSVALAQLTIIVAAAVTSLAVSGASIPSAVWGALPTSIIWFVGGFGMYSFLYAMAGAMVSRQEDAQAASLPVTMLLMVVYLSVFVFASDPSLPVARVLSMIPPFAPLVMPLRMASGEAATIEVVVAIVGMALTTLLVAVYAARIYTNLVLRRGARIGWAEALRTART